MNEQKNLQERFFRFISSRKAYGNNILYDVMDVLHVRKGAAYKRMNGETALTIEETVKIADHFGVSLDTVFKENEYVTFKHPFLNTERKSAQAFFDQFNFFLKPLKETSTVEDELKELAYLANELPIFYYFSHKYIFNFVLSVWTHLHWTDNQLSISDTLDYDQQIQSIRTDVLDSYYGYPVTEIWNSNMLSNLYQQIIFCITIRGFKEASYLEKLVKDIERLIEHLREIAVSGVKSIKGVTAPEGKLTIYLNDFGNYLNIVLYESKYIKSSFIGYDYPQFIVTHNEKFYDFSKQWFNKIKKRSVLISTEGYQYRELFFIKMENDFKSFKEHVDKLMGIYY